VGTSLFLRIYATFVISVLVFAGLAGFLVWVAASSWNEQRISELVALAEGHGQALAEALEAEDHARLAELREQLEAELDAYVTIFPHTRGRRFGPPIPPPGERSRHRPPVHDHPPVRAELRSLRRGQPLVRRRGLGPPTIGLALFERGFLLAPELGEELDGDPRGMREELRRTHGRFLAIVTLDPKHNPRRSLFGVGALLLLALAGGAWPLARSLTSRLAKLERSTQALARGELSHRAELAGPEPRDEVDLLALAFNDMADRLETLLTGQRTLLANVSHELRTPIARAKVLVEILGERIEMLRGAEQRGEALDPEDLARLERGLEEMEEDLAEVEALIRDLLTSGRLELGRGGALALERIELEQLCEDAAARFGAEVECEPGLELEGDRLLLERLVKNLLANARRACPEGTLRIRGRREADTYVLEVEDEGPGIPAGERSQIFEPFARLDEARARDQGGVGLGLYLCRQIAQAHGGSIRASERRDGKSGARFVIRLPAPVQ
jgi:signal transduction histidine kinase